MKALSRADILECLSHLLRKRLSLATSLLNKPIDVCESVYVFEGEKVCVCALRVRRESEIIVNTVRRGW